jgi:hypothetical protein
VTEQTIWLGPRATAFTAVCEACAEQQLGVESWLASTVAGTLRLDAERASISCTRGHVLRIERAGRVRPGARPRA